MLISRGEAAICLVPAFLKSNSCFHKNIRGRKHEQAIDKNHEPFGGNGNGHDATCGLW